MANYQRPVSTTLATMFLPAPPGTPGQDVLYLDSWSFTSSASVSGSVTVSPGSNVIARFGSQAAGTFTFTFPNGGLALTDSNGVLAGTSYSIVATGLAGTQTATFHYGGAPNGINPNG